MVYNLPSDSVAFIPLVHSDETGKAHPPGPGWSVKSSDPCVKAELSPSGDAVKLTPTAANGSAQIVHERDDVRDILDVTIVASVVRRVAFDIANARLEPADERRDEPGDDGVVEQRRP